MRLFRKTVDLDSEELKLSFIWQNNGRRSSRTMSIYYLNPIDILYAMKRFDGLAQKD